MKNKSFPVAAMLAAASLSTYSGPYENVGRAMSSETRRNWRRTANLTPKQRKSRAKAKAAKKARRINRKK